MLCLCSFLVVVAVAPGQHFSGSVQAANLPDPGELGRYAVGFTQFQVVDTTRNTTSQFGGRPIPAYVFYPVDAATVSGRDHGDAVIDYDPIYHCYGTTPPQRYPNCSTAKVSHSPDWEAFGLPPIFQDVPSSNDKPFPLVVFSPGWGGAITLYTAILTRLASHGIAVAITYHFLDGRFAWDCSGTPCVKDSLGRAMFNRPRDMSFMLTAILDRNDISGAVCRSANPGVLCGSVRPDLVAASGHSLGGYAALTMAGGDDEVCDNTTSTDPMPVVCNVIGRTDPDPRIKALVLLDSSNAALHFSEMESITLPSMALGQSFEKVGALQARQHVAMSGHPNYRADVVGAVHGSFTSACIGARVANKVGALSDTALQTYLNTTIECTAAVLDQREVNRLSAQYAVAFLKTHLAREANYQPILTPGWAITREINIRFFVTEPKSPTSLGEDPAVFRFFPYQQGGVIEQANTDPGDSLGDETQYP
jgi:predicted dienelactone hydrolase